MSTFVFALVTTVCFFALLVVANLAPGIAIPAYCIVGAIILVVWGIRQITREYTRESGIMSVAIGLSLMTAAAATAIFCCALIYEKTGIFCYRDNQYYGDNQGELALFQYIYFSTATWTTLGYGDYCPDRWSQLVASLEALMGYTTMGLIVGFVVNISYLKRESRENRQD